LPPFASWREIALFRDMGFIGLGSMGQVLFSNTGKKAAGRPLCVLRG
jgi:hypothetical protein